MKTKRERMVQRSLIIAGVGAGFFLLHMGITEFIADPGSSHGSLDQARLENERLLGERLQLEKEKMGIDARYRDELEARTLADQRVKSLQERVEAAVAHAHGLESAAKRARKLSREVEDLQQERGRLELQLATANSNLHDLQDRLSAAERERGELAAQVEDYRSGVHMVNNAEVDALRGKKGRLTVVARRTKEIRMAFDLPEGLAQKAAFKIISPNGKSYEGADPALSWTVDELEHEALASLGPDAGMVKERPQRVHLMFKPNAKLEPGTYRIDVMTDGAYLNTVLLNLR